MTPQGVFIVLEGIGGTGKTTLATTLVNRIKKCKRKVVWTRDPGGTEFGEAIRKIILKPKANIFALAERLAIIATRVQHVEEVIKPALKRGDIVVCERFLDSDYAYATARGLLSPVMTVNGLIGTPKPSLVLVLDLPADAAVKRMTTKHRFARESVDFHDRVRRSILNQALNNKYNGYEVIDASMKVRDVAKRAWLVVSQMLGLPYESIPRTP